MTNPPPVAPVEGHYALLRNGEAVGLIEKYQTKITYPYLFTSHLPHMNWTEAGVSDWDDGQYDIIAIISPADMQAVASGELERLRAALQNIRALAAKRQHEGGPDGNLKAIEEFAVYGLKGKNP